MKSGGSHPRKTPGNRRNPIFTIEAKKRSKSISPSAAAVRAGGVGFVALLSVAAEVAAVRSSEDEEEEEEDEEDEFSAEAELPAESSSSAAAPEATATPPPGPPEAVAAAAAAELNFAAMASTLDLFRRRFPSELGCAPDRITFLELCC